MYGRILFGASSVVCGVVAMIWHDSDLWQRVASIHGPLGAGIVWAFAGAMIAGGLGILIARATRLFACVLAAGYAFTVVACIWGMIRAPLDPGNYINGFEQFSIVCGALALYALGEPDAARGIVLGRIARYGLAVCSVSFAWAQWLFFQYTASLVPTWIPPNQSFWTGLTTVAFALAAIAMLIDVRARLAMQLEASMMGLFGIIVWIPIIVTHPAALTDWNEIATNYLIAAAAWLVADAPFSARDSA